MLDADRPPRSADGPLRRFDAAVETDPASRRLATITGVVFVAAGLPKFLLYGFELEQFERFGLPFPEALVVVAGTIEVAGGLALLRRRLLLPAALVLAATMVVAIVTSGLREGDVVPSLTVAPALLVALTVLLSRAQGAPAPPAAPPDRRRPSPRSSSRS